MEILFYVVIAAFAIDGMMLIFLKENWSSRGLEWLDV